LEKKLLAEQPIMSTIPTSVTEEQFNEHISPHLSKARRGYVCSIPLYKIFNYILYRLHTGCQWKGIAIDPDPNEPTKKKSAGKRSTIISANGAEMEVWNGCGSTVLRSFERIWTSNS
jgi:hypothetical protein